MVYTHINSDYMYVSYHMIYPFSFIYQPAVKRQQEKYFEDYLLFMDNRFFRLTITYFRQLAFQFAAINNLEHSSNDFVYGF